MGEVRNGVRVEVILLRVDAAGTVRFRVARAALGSDHPDRCARRLAALPGEGPALLHSTSWRYDPAGAVVLTYVAAPDTRPDLPARPLPGAVIALSAGPDEPAPVRVGVRNVAAHGVRHLAMLMRTDPVVLAGLLAFPPLAEAVRRAEPALSGQLRLPPGAGLSAADLALDEQDLAELDCAEPLCAEPLCAELRAAGRHPAGL